MLQLPQCKHNPLHHIMDDLECLRRTLRLIFEPINSTIEITPPNPALGYMYSPSNIHICLGQKISIDQQIAFCKTNLQSHLKTIFFSAVESRGNLTDLKDKLSELKKLKSEYFPVSYFGLHDHSMLDLDTGKILILPVLLAQMDNIKSKLQKGGGVLRINCAGGKERSVAITAIWLMHTRKIPLLEAMPAITKSRRVAKTIPPFTQYYTRPPLAAHAMGYVGYALFHLLNEEIQLLAGNPSPTPGSLLSNFFVSINKFSKKHFADLLKQEQLEYSLRPLLSLPIGDIDLPEQTNLTTSFKNVIRYLNNQLNLDISSILTNPPSKKPLSCLEKSNLAILKQSLEPQPSSSILPTASSPQHRDILALATNAILYLDKPEQNPGDFRYFSIPHIDKLLTTFPTLNSQPEIQNAVAKHINRLFIKISNVYWKTDKQKIEEAKQEIIAQYRILSKNNRDIFSSSIQELQATPPQTTPNASIPTTTETQPLLSPKPPKLPSPGKPFANRSCFFQNSSNTDQSDTIPVTHISAPSSSSATAYVPISPSP